MRRILISLTLLLFVATNYGCVAIFAAGAITGAGQYVKYNLDSIANRTYMGNLQHVTEVAVHALKSMQIAIDNIQREEAGARIFAAANNVNIKISLNTISVNTTKVSIDVSKYAVLKDKATARAIITQIDTVMVQGDKRLAKHML